MTTWKEAYQQYKQEKTEAEKRTAHIKDAELMARLQILRKEPQQVKDKET